VLDIGGEVGALVVHLTTETPSGELEACPRRHPDKRFHTGVHRRMIGGRPAVVAVYPALVEGDYDILDDDLRPIAHARVTGGEVCELHLAGSLRSRVSAG
jgi:hypothetical protein